MKVAPGPEGIAGRRFRYRLSLPFASRPLGRGAMGPGPRESRVPDSLGSQLARRPLPQFQDASWAWREAPDLASGSTYLLVDLLTHLLIAWAVAPMVPASGLGDLSRSLLSDKSLHLFGAYRSPLPEYRLARGPRGLVRTAGRRLVRSPPGWEHPATIRFRLAPRTDTLTVKLTVLVGPPGPDRWSPEVEDERPRAPRRAATGAGARARLFLRRPPVSRGGPSPRGA